MTSCDVLVVLDARFSGGTSAAAADDIAGFLAAGANVGLMIVRTHALDDSRDPLNPRIMDLLDLPGVSRIAPGAARAKVAFLHHPVVFFEGVEERARISADVTALVAHQMPFRGDGSLEYDPVATTLRARRQMGVRPLWAPVSGLARAQLRSFSPFIRLTSEDWPNVFDVESWRPSREKLTGAPLTIGRHGRVDMLKWPESAAKIAASLPHGPGRRIRVMGCPEAELRALGAELSHWDIAAFNAEPVSAFLDGVDIFSYHFHPLWLESFGRTVAEAALMECVCVLDPRLEATFGDIALYATAEEAPALIDRLAADPEGARAMGKRAAEVIRARHGAGSVAGRLARLGEDRGEPARLGSGSVRPLTAVRKVAGFWRRRLRGLPT